MPKVKYDYNEVVFYPAVSDNQVPMFTTANGGGYPRSAFGIPYGYFWVGFNPGHYIENRFFGDICVIYFYDDTGRVTITVNNNTILDDIAVTAFPKCGVYHIFEVPNLNVDYNTVRITVTSPYVNVVGMLVHKYNAPFIDLSLTSSYHVTNMLNASGILYSTTSTLAANASVTSSFIDLELASRTYNYILVTIYSNASGTLYLEFSNDNNNVDAVYTYNYSGGSTPYIQPIARVARYMRVRYVNGSTAQTTFRLYVRGLSSGL